MPLASPSEYVALSYVWGDESKPFSIPVIGEEDGRALGWIPLTKSLYDALQDLRDCDHFQQKTFWIDQLCIDQDDKLEKNKQVAQMLQIYERAKETVTYLGPEQRRDDEALLLLDKIYRFCKKNIDTEENLMSFVQKVSEYFKWKRSDITSRGKRPNFDPDALNACVLAGTRFEPNGHDPRWINEGVCDHLASIVYSTWNERAWLVQENMANKQAGFLRGPHYIVWESVGLLSILSLLRILSDARIPLDFTGDDSACYLFLDRITRFEALDALESDNRDTLYELMVINSGKECSDTRDKIYAFINLSKDAGELGLRPDYQKSPAQVFTDLAVAWIGMHRRNFRGWEDEIMSFNNLRILEWAWPGIAHDPSIPSWVPSFPSHWFPARGLLRNKFSRPPWSFIPPGLLSTLVGAAFTEDSLQRDLCAGYPRDNPHEASRPLTFESTESVERGILLTQGLQLSPLAAYLGTFPEVRLAPLDTINLKDIIHINTILDEAHGHIGDDYIACAALCHTLMRSSTWQGKTVEPKIVAEAYREFKRFLQRSIETASKGSDFPGQIDYPGGFYLLATSPNVPENIAYIVKTAVLMNDQSLWLLENGNLALVHNTVRADHTPVVLLGGRYIYFLRPSGTDKFKYTGFGHVDGFMLGEAFSEPGWEKRLETFKIE